MNDLQRTSIATGILFLAADVAGVPGKLLTAPVLGGSDFLAGATADADRLAFGAALVAIMALCCIGINVAMYPLLRRVSPAIAIGSTALRTVESVFLLVGALALLALPTLGHDAAAGTIDMASARTSADLLRALSAQSGPLSSLAFGAGAFLYYVAFYVWRLTPRWLAGWGIAAIAIYFATALGAIVTRTDFDSLSALLMPLALQEVVLAVYLIVRGFREPVDTATSELGKEVRTVRPAAAAAS